jgi:hypothetical protein
MVNALQPTVSFKRIWSSLSAGEAPAPPPPPPKPKSRSDRRSTYSPGATNPNLATLSKDVLNKPLTPNSQQRTQQFQFNSTAPLPKTLRASSSSTSSQLLRTTTLSSSGSGAGIRKPVVMARPGTTGK